jgi:hypothetical protein
VPPIDLGATRTPSPAQQTHDIVDDLNVEEDETINVDDDSRTEKRLNWTVPDRHTIGRLKPSYLHAHLKINNCLLLILFLFLFLFLFCCFCRPVLGCVIQRTQ